MLASFVVLTGAAGSGKTTIARAVSSKFPAVLMERFDSIGVPRLEVMRAFGEGHQPGGPWQRAMTLQWVGRLEPVLRSGRPVLLEGQIRLAFIEEAIAICNLPHTRIILIDCNDHHRARRLHHNRNQPELVNEETTGWARYLYEEAANGGYEIVDTVAEDTADTVDRLGVYLNGLP